jgi:hypothetical protein
VPGVHRVISNLKTWLRGTHHGVGADHLDAYLDEFVFRFNRRHRPSAGFGTLLGLGSAHEPVPASAITAPFGRPTGARGRATGQTSRRWASPAPPPDPAAPPEPQPWFSHEVREHDTEVEFIRAVARLVGTVGACRPPLDRASAAAEDAAQPEASAEPAGARRRLGVRSRRREPTQGAGA